MFIRRSAAAIAVCVSLVVGGVVAPPAAFAATPIVTIGSPEPTPEHPLPQDPPAVSSEICKIFVSDLRPNGQDGVLASIRVVCSEHFDKAIITSTIRSADSNEMLYSARGTTVEPVVPNVGYELTITSVFGCHAGVYIRSEIAAWRFAQCPQPILYNYDDDKYGC